MIRQTIASAIALTAIMALASCGGGGDDPCGAKSQILAIEFAVKSHNLEVGKPATLKSTITPESCRGDMTFSVRNGSIPDGMALVNGDVAGTPTKAGVFKFQVGIDAVAGYEALSPITAPRSSLVTATVTVPH